MGARDGGARGAAGAGGIVTRMTADMERDCREYEVQDASERATLVVYVVRAKADEWPHAPGARRATQPHAVASCDPDALGFCLQTLAEERQITPSDRVGVLERTDGASRWLINPYGKGRNKQ